MSCEGGDFLHCGVFPYNNLVERVAMRRNNLVCGFREHEITDLRTCVNVVDWLQAVSVPEANASIGCAASCCQETSLIGVPSDCLDSSLMLTEFSLSLLSM